jgi:hypothetical protein
VASRRDFTTGCGLDRPSLRVVCSFEGPETPAVACRALRKRHFLGNDPNWGHLRDDLALLLIAQSTTPLTVPARPDRPERRWRQRLRAVRFGRASHPDRVRIPRRRWGALDATVGVLGSFHDREGVVAVKTPGDQAVRSVDGWIFGQTPGEVRAVAGGASAVTRRTSRLRAARQLREGAVTFREASCSRGD